VAINSVSAATPNQWQLISSVTPTASATDVTFSSIAGYKTIMLSLKDVTSSGGFLSCYFNGDLTGGDYAGSSANGTGTYISLGTSTTNPRSAFAIIYDVNQSIPHLVNASSWYTAGAPFQAWTNPTPITSISVYLDGQTFSGAGTIALYGIAA
jgi:hypothetical protein